MGKGCTRNEGMFIAFSGLRGAICISLGLSFSLAALAGLTKTSAYEGQRLVFYVGAIAALTLVFNATFAESALHILGLSENTVTSQSIQVMRHYTKKRLIEASTSSWLEVPMIHRKIIITRCPLLKEVDIACDKNEKFFRDNFLNPNSRQNANNYSNTINGNNNTNEKSSHHVLGTRRGSHSDPPIPQPSTTTAAAASGMTSSTIESELNSIMSQKLKAHEANVLHSNILKQAQEYRDSHPCVCADAALMDSVRSAFLECVRSYYWSRVHKAIIDRHSYIARTLIASVDLGLETTDTPGLQVSE
jgi:hypothetical protein